MHTGYLISLLLILIAAIGAAEIIDTTLSPARYVPNTSTTTHSGTNATTTPIPARPTTTPETTHATTTAEELTKPTTTTTTVKKITVSTTSPPQTAKPKPVTSPPPITEPQVINADPKDINTIARNALVNIFCDADPLSLLPSTMGSGMFVDPRGIVLTNAHVAEHMLLANYRVPNAVTCYARNGSPARIAYKLSLLYIPPVWVTENASAITQSNRRRFGSGMHDFALLYVTESATDTSLPDVFPYVQIEYSESYAQKGGELFAAAYPAELLPDRNKLNALYPVSAYATIENLLTFTENLFDVVHMGGNAVSQSGASGGGVLTSEGKLAAVIATVLDGATPQDRDFQAITISHISRTMKDDNGLTLGEFLDKDPNSQLTHFRNTVAPALTAALSGEYQKVHQQQ